MREAPAGFILFFILVGFSLFLTALFGYAPLWAQLPFIFCFVFIFLLTFFRGPPHA